MVNYGKNTQINFYFPFGVEPLLENDLYFNGSYVCNNGVFVAFLIVGTFNTQKGFTFFNDFIARMFLTFNAEVVKKRELEIRTSKKQIELFDKIPKELKSLTQSTQLLSLNALEKYRQQNFTGKGDWLFLALKEYAINFIIHNKILNYQAFENWALNNFLHKSKKSRSDIICKTRSIFNYYLARNFEIEQKKYTRKTQNEKDLKMTRQENLQRYKDKKQAKTQQTIKDFFEKIAQIDKENNPFLKKNGDYHLSKIADFLKITRATLYKHLENLQVII